MPLRLSSLPLPALQVGAYLAWPVRVLMIITAPISWPISKLLDWLLGEESALFRCGDQFPMLFLRCRGVALQVS